MSPEIAVRLGRLEDEEAPYSGGLGLQEEWWE
jgi:hypothetical protein